MGAYKIEWRDQLGNPRTEYAQNARVSRFLDDLGGATFKLFDTQSLPSGGSKAAAEKTPAADDQRTVDESETPESGEATKSRPNGGETAGGSGVSPEVAQGLQEYFEGRDCLPTSPPTTPADSPATPSEPTTTRCANCLLPPTPDIIDALAGLHLRAAKTEEWARWLREAAMDLCQRCCVSTTQAPAAPASDAEQPI